MMGVDLVYVEIGLVPVVLVIWFIASMIRFLCSGRCEKQVQKKRLILMVVSGGLMTLCFVAIIVLYYFFLMAISHM